MEKKKEKEKKPQMITRRVSWLEQHMFEKSLLKLVAFSLYDYNIWAQTDTRLAKMMAMDWLKDTYNIESFFFVQYTSSIAHTRRRPRNLKNILAPKGWSFYVVDTCLYILIEWKHK